MSVTYREDARSRRLDATQHNNAPRVCGTVLYPNEMRVIIFQRAVKDFRAVELTVYTPTVCTAKPDATIKRYRYHNRRLIPTFATTARRDSLALQMHVTITSITIDDDTHGFECEQKRAFNRGGIECNGIT